MSHKSSMHGSGESSDRIVPAKSANKGRGLPAEQVEGRRSAKEIPRHGPMLDTAPENIGALQCHGSACRSMAWACSSPRWEPCALVARARVCAGGSGQSLSLPRPFFEFALPGRRNRLPHLHLNEDHA